MLSIKAYRVMIQQEIQRVINLPVIERVGQKWAGLHQRPSGTIWMNDSVIHLSNIGESKKVKFEEEGIKTLEDMANLTDLELTQLSKKIRIGEKSLLKFRSDAKEAQPGTTPYPIAYDYVEGSTNPYATRYGDDI